MEGQERVQFREVALVEKIVRLYDESTEWGIEREHAIAFIAQALS